MQSVLVNRKFIYWFALSNKDCRTTCIIFETVMSTCEAVVSSLKKDYMNVHCFYCIYCCDNYFCSSWHCYWHPCWRVSIAMPWTIEVIKFSYNTLEMTVFTFVYQPNTTRFLAWRTRPSGHKNSFLCPAFYTTLLPRCFADIAVIRNYRGNHTYSHNLFISTDAILNRSEPNVILTAHATKVNRTEPNRKRVWPVKIMPLVPRLVIDTRQHYFCLETDFVPAFQLILHNLKRPMNEWFLYLL